MTRIIMIIFCSLVLIGCLIGAATAEETRSTKLGLWLRDKIGTAAQSVGDTTKALAMGDPDECPVVIQDMDEACLEYWIKEHSVTLNALKLELAGRSAVE